MIEFLLVLWLATAIIANAGLVVHPVELQVVPETTHPTVLVIADTDGLQLLLTQLYWQLEPAFEYDYMYGTGIIYIKEWSGLPYFLARPNIRRTGHHDPLPIGD